MVSVRQGERGKWAEQRLSEMRRYKLVELQERTTHPWLAGLGDGRECANERSWLLRMSANLIICNQSRNMGDTDRLDG
jgi:hypothetical protein